MSPEVACGQFENCHERFSGIGSFLREQRSRKFLAFVIATVKEEC